MIPVHNRHDITKDCLKSLYAENDPTVHVIVIDDGSTDGTSQMIKTEFSQTILLRGDGELWWTGATNVGVKKALELGQPSDYTLLLNDDLIIRPGYFKTLKDAINRQPNALIGSVVLEMDDPDLIKEGGVHVNWYTASHKSPNTGKRVSSFPHNYVETVDYLTGRGVLIPFTVFQDVGLYDEGTFKQCGDIELPVRAKRHGYKLLVDFNMRVYSFPENPNNINRKETYKLSEFRKYFFSFRSNMSFTCRYWLARRMIPNIFLRTLYLSFDLSKIAFRYFSRVELR